MRCSGGGTPGEAGELATLPKPNESPLSLLDDDDDEAVGSGGENTGGGDADAVLILDGRRIFFAVIEIVGEKGCGNSDSDANGTGDADDTDTDSDSDTDMRLRCCRKWELFTIECGFVSEIDKRDERRRVRERCFCVAFVLVLLLPVPLSVAKEALSPIECVEGVEVLLEDKCSGGVTVH